MLAERWVEDTRMQWARWMMFTGLVGFAFVPACQSGDGDSAETVASSSGGETTGGSETETQDTSGESRGSDSGDASDSSDTEGMMSGNDDADLPPIGDGMALVPGQNRFGMPQVVFLEFNDITLTGVEGCNSARDNCSFILPTRFDTNELLFEAFTGGDAAKSEIISKLKTAFTPWEVRFVTERPKWGAYTLVVVSRTDANPGLSVIGRAPVDCPNGFNNNPSDVVLVYKTDSQTTHGVYLTIAHELGHSFGLTHVVRDDDFMYWQNNGKGAGFFTAEIDEVNGKNYCLDSSTQDEPAILTQGLDSVDPTCPGLATRVFGATRYETAVEVSKSLYPSSAPEAVLALGSDVSVDALTAGPLARKLGGPLLLSTTDSVPTATMQELARLNVETVTIVGGEAAISTTVEQQLQQNGFATTRIAGANRYDTAAQIADIIKAPGKLAFVASGNDQNLVDALAASGPAAALGAPILLVQQDTIPSETSDTLAALGIERTIVVGGASAVADSVVNALPDATRVAGATRYDTAEAVARKAVEEGVDPASVFVARGDKMPDALASAAAGRVILLSDPEMLPDPTVHFIVDHAAHVDILGGVAALEPDVERASCGALMF